MTSEQDCEQLGVWRFAVDGQEHKVFRHRIPVAEVFDLVERSPHDWSLEAELEGGGRVTLDPDDEIKLVEGVVDAFFLKPRHHRPHDRVTLIVVVNSEPVSIEVDKSQVLSTLVSEVLERVKTAGRAEDEWELKTEGGVVLDLSLTIEAAGLQDGATLFLSLKAGAAGEATGELLVDPTVSRAKFDEEIAAFRRAGAAHGRRGIWLVRVEYPKAVLAFAAPNFGPIRLLAFGAVLDFQNFDLWAPSVRIVDPITEVPYKGGELPLHAQLPRRQHHAPQTRGATDPSAVEIGRFMQWHRPDEVPFLCHPGVREYHEHPAHTGDSWHLHRGRGEGTLSRIMDILFQYGSSKLVGLQLVPAISTPDP